MVGGEFWPPAPLFLLSFFDPRGEFWPRSRLIVPLLTPNVFAICRSLTFGTFSISSPAAFLKAFTRSRFAADSTGHQPRVQQARTWWPSAANSARPLSVA